MFVLCNCRKLGQALEISNNLKVMCASNYTQCLDWVLHVEHVTERGSMYENETEFAAESNKQKSTFAHYLPAVHFFEMHSKTVVLRCHPLQLRCV